MRMPLHISMAAALLTAAGPLRAQNLPNDPTRLTDSALAEIPGVHWWVVQLPANVEAGDMVGPRWISPDGSYGGVLTALVEPRDTLRIYCWKNVQTDRAVTVVKNGTGGGGSTEDPLHGRSLPASTNGSVVKEGDLLLKLHDSSTSGDIQLRFIIERKNHHERKD